MNSYIPAAVAAFTLFTGAASAATFDFAGEGNGSIGSDTLVLAEGTFTSSGGGLFLNANFASSICAVGPSCAHDLNLDFNGLASNITFSTGGWGLGDSVLVSLFDSGNNLLESLTIESADTFSFASVGVASIFFDDSSSDAGVDYGSWSFDLETVAAVPLPAALPLLLAGLGGIAALRRRRKV